MSTEQKIIKNKIGLLRLAEELGNASRACRLGGRLAPIGSTQSFKR
jgi:hypothetical protein